MPSRGRRALFAVWLYGSVHVTVGYVPTRGFSTGCFAKPRVERVQPRRLATKGDKSSYSSALRHAAKDAFDRHKTDVSLTLSARQFRRAMRHMGTDLSQNSTTRIIEKYASSCDPIVSRADLETIVVHSTVASPSRYFWIPVDPRGEHIRLTRPRWNRFGYAGLATPSRIVHYGLGVASIAVGTYDAALFVGSAGSHLPLTHEAVLTHALIHTAAAYASLPRFRYRFDANAPWKLWMPTARDASMWPSFLQNTWYCIALASDLMRPSDDAFFPFYDPAFIASCYASISLYVYSNVRAMLEEDDAKQHHVESIWFSLLNSIPPALDPIRAIVLVHSPLVYAQYQALVSQYPAISQIVQEAVLLGMYTGSVVCALSSAEHYGAVDKKFIANVARMLALTATVVPIFALTQIEDGEAWTRLVQNAAEGVRSFV